MEAGITRETGRRDQLGVLSVSVVGDRAEVVGVQAEEAGTETVQG